MLGFSIVVLSSIWILQTQFLNPYFSSARISNTPEIANQIIELLKRPSANVSDEDSIREISAYLEENNSCAYILDKANYKAVTFITQDSSCRNSFTTDALIKYADEIDVSSKNSASWNYTNSLSQDKYIYGKSFRVNNTISSGMFEVTEDAKYYVFVDTSLSIVRSTTNIIKSQFMFVSMIVFAASILVALFIARKMSKPIVQMKKKANTLATGDFTVRFDHGGYSELNELADTLNYATEEMARTDELRRDLVANVSHDIKTPLTMIKAYSEMIQDISGDNPEKRNEHLQVIIKETQNLTNLVNDMLEVSKYQSGTMTFHEINYDIVTQIQEIIHMNAENNYGVEIIYEGLESAEIRGDETKLSQVLNNYISNAIKHHGEDKQVIVRVLSKNSVIRVEVEDHGSGIAPEDINQIWDRYFKIDKNYQRETQGTGLGLSIVKGICDLAKLNYGVSSTLGEGTMFYVELPKPTKKVIIKD